MFLPEESLGKRCKVLLALPFVAVFLTVVLVIDWWYETPLTRRDRIDAKAKARKQNKP